MPRSKKNPEVSIAVGKRLRTLVEDILKMSPDALATALGLKTKSSVMSALAGRGSLDPDRLVLLAGLRDARERTPNLHWLLTGEGNPVMSPEVTINPEIDRLHDWLDADRFEALRKLTETPLR